MASNGGSFQPGRAVAPVSKVELSISCKKLRNRDALSKSDPMAVVYLKEFGTNRFVEIGRTEMIKNDLNPDFARKFLIDYHFEESQALKIEIYDVDSPRAVLQDHDFLGRIECTLGEIVGAPGGKINRFLTGTSMRHKEAGSILVCTEEVGASKEIAYMQWKGIKLDKKDFLGKSDPFIQIFRMEADGSKKLAYRSEAINNTLNPVWKPFRVPVRNLCVDDNADRTIRFECFDWDNDGGQAHDLIGVFETTFRKLSSGANRSENVYDLINPKKKEKKKDYKNSGQLHLTQFVIDIDHSFLDYVRGGTQLHFSVAVDFTASNGEPHDPKSLHYCHPQMPNQYMVALKAVGEIIQDYDYDKMFPALGFGAKLPPDGRLSHEFFLNFTNDPHCYGVNGILDAYRRSVTSVQLYGPTNFSPVINHVARLVQSMNSRGFAANSRDGTQYFILLIITDGAITDLDNTIASIINASSLPMSIIIVGVGQADFSAMEFLDADKGRLRQGSRVAERDIVQFVPMRNYIKNNSSYDLSQARLAKDVLAEVPLQLTSYMKKMNVKPKPPVHVDVPEPTLGGGPDTAPHTTPRAPPPPMAPTAGDPYGQAPYGSGPSSNGQHQQQPTAPAGFSQPPGFAGQLQPLPQGTPGYPPSQHPYPMAGGAYAPPPPPQYSPHHQPMYQYQPPPYSQSSAAAPYQPPAQPPLQPYGSAPYQPYPMGVGGQPNAPPPPPPYSGSPTPYGHTNSGDVHKQPYHGGY